MKRFVTAVCGGIGSGKSVICRILQAMGYDVYDCDSRARSIMDSDEVLKDRIAAEICSDAITAGRSIDRRVLGACVFSHKEKLAALNSLVHGSVRKDLAKWIEAPHKRDAVFVETAILYQSGLDRMVQCVWEVVAPVDIRVERVCRRNGISAEEVAARMESQKFTPESIHPDTCFITNDGNVSLLRQISALLESAD